MANTTKASSQIGVNLRAFSILISGSRKVQHGRRVCFSNSLYLASGVLTFLDDCCDKLYLDAGTAEAGASDSGYSVMLGSGTVSVHLLFMERLKRDFPSSLGLFRRLPMLLFSYSMK